MSKNKNNGMKIVKVICFIGAIIILFELTLMGVYYAFHPTYYKYNDIWVKGKTIEEIEARYGRGDIVASDGELVGYRIEKFPHIFCGCDINYIIFFDEFGKAKSIGIYEVSDFGLKSWKDKLKE